MNKHIEYFKQNPRNSTQKTLEEVFKNADSRPLETLINEGGREIKIENREVHNDEHWRGFFPSDHIFSSAIPFLPLGPGFHKRFWTENGSFVGETTDSDGIIRGHNQLQEVKYKGHSYALLTYEDLQYRPFYDLLLPVTDDLMVGKAYFGRFPYGVRLLTFGLTRRYEFDFLAPADHAILWEDGKTPEPETLEGRWNVQLVSNAGLLAPLFEFKFMNTPQSLKGRYEVLDKIGGNVRLEFEEEMMKMFDFTNWWHDEIKQITDDFMIGKYCQTKITAGNGSLGHLHGETEDGQQRICIYYVMNRKQTY